MIAPQLELGFKVQEFASFPISKPAPPSYPRNSLFLPSFMPRFASREKLEGLFFPVTVVSLGIPAPPCRLAEYLFRAQPLLCLPGLQTSGQKLSLRVHL